MVRTCLALHTQTDNNLALSLSANRVRIRQMRVRQTRQTALITQSARDLRSTTTALRKLDSFGVITECSAEISADDPAPVLCIPDKEAKERRRLTKGASWKRASPTTTPSYQGRRKSGDSRPRLFLKSAALSRKKRRPQGYKRRADGPISVSGAMAGMCLVLSAFVAVPFLYLWCMLAEQIPYSEQGFFCDDDEIRNPNRPSTVPSHKMYLVYAIIAVVLIPIAEFSLVRFLSRKGQRVQMIQQRGFQLHPWLFNVAFFILALLCGDLCASIAANVGKRTISRLRPNFISVCQPDLATLCPVGSPNRYVSEYTCLGEANPDLHYSFPSGHATHSAFFAVFMILYLNKRLRVVDPVRPFLQFAIFLLAFYVTLSRVRDFKHRLADVLGGAVLGGSIGCVMVHLIMKNFRPYRYRLVEADGYDEIGSSPSPPPNYPDVVVDKPRVYGSVA
uniref:AcidPPc domain-containing protein n=1 Tax=Steinernema glaseri TaxID=37863 RepID=A0A1I7ZHC8_9BILA